MKIGYMQEMWEENGNEETNFSLNANDARR